MDNHCNISDNISSDTFINDNDDDMTAVAAAVVDAGDASADDAITDLLNYQRRRSLSVTATINGRVVNRMRRYVEMKMQKIKERRYLPKPWHMM